MIKLFDPLAEQAEHQAALQDAARRVIDSGRYILGEEVAAFEAELAATLEVAPGSVVALSSGTDALILALRALGVGPGDEVVVPAFSFVSTASAVLWVGARPVFADIDPATLTLCPEDAARRVSAKTRALIVAHLFGCPADLTRLGALCDAHRLVLIEDTAQALGGRWQRRPLGTHGDAGALSFFPTKHLGALGDAGALVLKDPQRAEVARRLRSHGDEGAYQHTALGLNARMGALQAALLRVKLSTLSQANDRRRALAARYAQALGDLPGLVLPPLDPPDGLCVPQPFVVRTSQRDAFARHLSRLGVESKVYYPTPLPAQPIFASSLEAGSGPWPCAEEACAQALAIPMHSALDPRSCSQVITAVRDFFA